MKRIPPSLVAPGHADFLLLSSVLTELRTLTAGRERLEAKIPRLLRQALDEVIDTQRTGRINLAELEKTEKTYLGTKIEILFRDYLGASKGRLDLMIGGQDVDVKNTIGTNWMIPTEAINSVCILIAADQAKGRCYCGLFKARLNNLTKGKNKDSKRSVSADGFREILWILNGVTFDQGFWHGRDPDAVAQIMDGSVGGTERLVRLFTKVQNVPIPRSVVASVARQLDPTKRVRRNGGARDPLAKIGIVVLSEKKDTVLGEKLRLPRMEKGDFLSYSPSKESEIKLLADHGHTIS